MEGQEEALAGTVEDVQGGEEAGGKEEAGLKAPSNESWRKPNVHSSQQNVQSVQTWLQAATQASLRVMLLRRPLRVHLKDPHRSPRK